MKESENKQLHPIGVIHSSLTECAGAPIQSSLAQGVKGKGIVEVFEEFAAGLSDLEGFDRVWLLYWFHRTGEPRLRVTPFLDTRERGLFATRAPCRPNPIGLSCVRLLAVEGTRLHVADLDALDGSPLLDIKPYAPRFDHFAVKRCGWLDAAPDAVVKADERFQCKIERKETNQ